MTVADLAILGGPPVRTRAWPTWPLAEESTIAAVTDVLRSTRWAISGPYDGRTCYERRFAEAFAEFEGARYCTPTTSGTAALTIGLQALDIGPGKEVLVTGLTWVAPASAVVHLGATAVLVDCDRETLAMSPMRAREACTDSTAAILVVHPWCSVADIDMLCALAAERGIPLIEDCAQAHGARWRGQRVGTFGAIGCFSMQQSKLLTAGEGGAVVTDDPDLNDRLEQLRCDGRRFVEAPEVGRLELLEVGSVLGRNLCLSELQAAVLFERLSHLDAQNELRATRVRCLERLLDDIGGVTYLLRDDRVTTPTFYNYVLRLEPAAFADAPIDVLSEALTAELGTPVNPVYEPLDRHPLLASANQRTGGPRLISRGCALSEARRARQTCVTLTHPVLLDEVEGMEDIARALTKVQRGAGRLRGLHVGRRCMSF